MKGLKKTLYLAGAMLLAGSVYSQTSDSTSNRVVINNQVIETYDLKTELKEVPLNMANLFANPKDEIKNFSKYTSEDKEKCVNYMADFGISRNENYEKRITELEEKLATIPALEANLKNKEAERAKFEKKYKSCMEDKDQKQSPKKK